MEYTRKYSFRLSIIVIVTEIILHTYYGYSASGNVLLLLLMGVIAFVRYCLIFVYAISLIVLIRRRQYIKVVVSSLLFIVAFTLIPKIHFETLGALLSIYHSKPEQILHDARIAADEYQPMTCIGPSSQRFPCDSPISSDHLPSSIAKTNVRNVLILENYVLIEKFGLYGSFRGIVAFQEGYDPWINEEAVTLQNGCSTCWKIRLADGLYWYQDPSHLPIFTSPLN